MQRYFPYHVVDDAVLPQNSGVFQRVLPAKGMVSALDIEFRATNGPDGNTGNPIFGVIDRVEITGDGVDKILSLTGYNLMQYLRVIHGKQLPGIYNELGDAEQRIRYQIPFGRFFGDPDYGLRLDKYSEVRVDIAYNLGAVRPVGDDAYLSGSGVVDVVAHMTPPGVSYTSRGCRRCIERQFYTSLSTGEVSYDLVADYPYTAVGAFIREAGMEPYNNVTEFRLDLGAGKPRLYFYEHQELMEMMQLWYPGDYSFKQRIFRAASSVFSTYTGTVESIQMFSPSGTDVGYTSIAGDRVTVAGPTTTEAIEVVAAGMHQGNILMVPLADQSTWNDPLMPAEVADAVLSLVQGNAGAEVRVFTEQILPQ